MTVQRTPPECVRLQYELLEPGGAPRSIDQVVLLTSTRCGYGRRRWFLCGGPSCGGRRVAVLYLANELFWCSECHSLAYESEGLDRVSRAIQQMRKVRRRMGSSEHDSVFAPLPPRPKRMRRTTYQRLVQRAEQAGQRYCRAASESCSVFENAMRRQLGDDAPPPAWNDPPSDLEILMLKERESERQARRKERESLKSAPAREQDLVERVAREEQRSEQHALQKEEELKERVLRNRSR
jgi:hypothetical protein